jgi:(2Fe-2S) ferredoxin
MAAKVLVSVCKGDSCVGRGGDVVCATLEKRVATLGPGGDVKVKRGGCYGLCKIGPNVIVREGPAAAAVENDIFGSDCEYRGKAGETHYAQVDEAGVERIVDEHLRDGHPVTDLMER